jgi:hypothetical protein
VTRPGAHPPRRPSVVAPDGPAPHPVEGPKDSRDLKDPKDLKEKTR